MIWRCLSSKASGEIVRIEYFTTEVEAQQHAVEHSSEGFICAVTRGALAADGTFTPAA